jgi:hypothetical protein
MKEYQNIMERSWSHDPSPYLLRPRNTKVFSNDIELRGIQNVPIHKEGRCREISYGQSTGARVEPD